MRLGLLILFSLSSLASFSQTYLLRGKITDQQGNPVPASVYQKNTTKGTSANDEGEYQLKLEAGTYDFIFKAVGYQQENRQMVIKGNYNQDITLTKESYQLTEVVLSAGEDPAYAMIRKAINRRKSYLEEVNAYTCEVYIKGVQKLLAAPKKFLGADLDKFGKEAGLDSNRQGILYLSESESRLSFMQPNNVHEEMISSKVSGSNRAFSFNRASDMIINFYENLQTLGDISNRPYVSPIADNALGYYNYKYIGSITENGESVNKIEVFPKRKGDPVFSGYIYLIDESWRIQSADLYLTKDAGINFVDTIKISQQYFPVNDKIWMPSNVKFDFVGGIFKFRFGGYYIAVYKDYVLDAEPNKKSFAEVMRITKEVNKKDSIYWKDARPVPLTAEEQTDYIKKEKLAILHSSRQYLDSLDKENNKFKPLSFIIGQGYTLRHRYTKETYRFSSLINAVFYNTVEGFGFNYAVNYVKQIDSASNRFISLTPKIRYGFSNKSFNPSLSGTLPVKKLTLSYTLGSDIIDVNNLGSIKQLGNSINSLYYERNFMKLYEKQGASITAQHRIIGGLVVSAQAEWANRKYLSNTSDYKFRDIESEEFTSNNPFSPSSDVPLFPDNKAFKIGLRANYNFSNKYETYPTGRRYLPSKYPRLSVSYTKGINNVLGSDVDYDLLSSELTKSDIRLGLYGNMSFMVGAGKFLNNNKVFYPDYKHFVGNLSLAIDPKYNSFLYLDYYQQSTADSYAEAHLEHNFSGLFLSKIPLIRKLKLEEIVGGNYLTTPAYKNYSEFYFGLNYLTFRVLYGYAFQDAKRMDQGFKISYSLGF